jgi:hypothetical protein
LKVPNMGVFSKGWAPDRLTKSEPRIA